MYINYKAIINGTFYEYLEYSRNGCRWKLKPLARRLR